MDAFVYVLTEHAEILRWQVTNAHSVLEIISENGCHAGINVCKQCGIKYAYEDRIEICEDCGVYQDCLNCIPAKFVEHDEELDCYETRCVNCYEPHGHCG